MFDCLFIYLLDMMFSYFFISRSEIIMNEVLFLCGEEKNSSEKQVMILCISNYLHKHSLFGLRIFSSINLINTVKIHSF